MKANDLSQFEFEQIGSGCYKVKYETRFRGDYWVASITDMTLIDATKNAEWAKLKDIKHLRDVVKAKGAHYGKWGAWMRYDHNLPKELER